MNKQQIIQALSEGNTIIARSNIKGVDMIFNCFACCSASSEHPEHMYEKIVEHTEGDLSSCRIKEYK